MAVEVPPTKPATQSPGSPSSSSSQRWQTASSLDTTGELTYMAAFWSQASISHLAASAGGRAPPLTKPK